MKRRRPSRPRFLYALRDTGGGVSLYEFRSRRDYDDQVRADKDHAVEWLRCDAQRAHAWVKADRLHNTGLFMEDGRIRRAYDPEGC